MAEKKPSSVSSGSSTAASRPSGKNAPSSMSNRNTSSAKKNPSAGYADGRSASYNRAAAAKRAGNAKRARKKNRRSGCLNSCLAVVATVFCALVGLAIYSQLTDLSASRGERASLLGIMDTLEADMEDNESGRWHSDAFDAEMRSINPDYLGWIRIDDTPIDYPVVNGVDNEKYLDISFYGERNSLGTLFTDYRTIGESDPNIIIYGHNSRQGDMFGSLRNYLDEQYMDEHPVITLVLNGQVAEYEIFSARMTDVGDPAYFLDFSAPGSFDAFAQRCGAPPGGEQIITLSTCVSGFNVDERVVVQGILR